MYWLHHGGLKVNFVNKKNARDILTLVCHMKLVISKWKLVQLKSDNLPVLKKVKYLHNLLLFPFVW